MAALDEAIFFILMASFFAVTLCEKKEEFVIGAEYADSQSDGPQGPQE